MSMSRQAQPGSIGPHGDSRAGSGKASLSVILISAGTIDDIDRAVRVLGGSLRQLDAQLVVVRAGEDVPATFSARHPGALFVSAPADATRAQLCDLAMTYASGDIVALREDLAVRDGEWLESFRSSVLNSAQPSDVEVMDWNLLQSKSAADGGRSPAPTAAGTPGGEQEPPLTPATKGGRSHASGSAEQGGMTLRSRGS